MLDHSNSSCRPVQARPPAQLLPQGLLVDPLAVQAQGLAASQNTRPSMTKPAAPSPTQALGHAEAHYRTDLESHTAMVSAGREHARLERDCLESLAKLLHSERDLARAFAKR